jgi:molybdopterin-containing oxidoreductase family iron-sulfur binding subunit
MDRNRRDFLKIAGITALGLGGGLPLLRGDIAAEETGHGHGAPDENQLAMVVDLKKCKDEHVRKACTDACHRVHNVPAIPDPEEEIKWIWTEKFADSFPDRVHDRAASTMKEMPVMVLCNHCSNPPCVRVCPTQATWKRDSDGIVMMDMHRCIGCRFCIAACPYGARSFNWRDPRPFLANRIELPYPTRTKGVVEKCNFCAERLRKGLEPACVEAARNVPGGRGALTFGDVSDPRSEVARILKASYSIVRKASLGTGPNVYYVI